MTGVMLEGVDGQPFAWSIDMMEDWTCIAEEASVDLLDNIQNLVKENPSPKPQLSRMANALKAFCGVDVHEDMIEDASKG